MTGIGELGNSQILGFDRVKKEDVNKTVESQKESAKVDGFNNVILVKEEGDEAIVANIKLDSSIKLSDVAFQKDGKLGEFVGQIKFVDNGDDDKALLESKKPEQAKPVESTPAQVTPTTQSAPTQATTNTENDIYKLSQQDAFKLISTLHSLDHPDKSTVLADLKETKKDFTPREMKETIKEFQGIYGNSKTNADGVWGTETFLMAKSAYYNFSNVTKHPTDKEFRNIVNDFIKFHDGKMTLDALVQKYKFEDYK